MVNESYSVIPSDFRKMWVEGHSLPKLSKKYGVSRSVMLGWRTKLKLPKRASGKHTRLYQESYMQRQLESK